MELLAAGTQVAGSSGWVIAIVISILSGLVGAMVLFNLNGIKNSVDRISTKVDGHDERIKSVEKEIGDRNGEYQAIFTSKEDWVRAEGYTRISIEKLTALINRLDGKLDFAKMLPEMGASMGKEIGKSITNELNKLVKETKS